ncbi:MAG: anthranilate synthase component I [Gammaproteobacteria bacterium]|nr:MAG: anthranilate synthase component I [Gammaproteobacteria bacterium]
MDSAQFDLLTSQGYTCIPLVREVLADLDTPLSAYLKLAHQPYTYLFESVQGGERWGRYSFIGLSSAEHIKVFGNKVVHEKNNQVHEQNVQDPLTWVQSFLQQFNVPDIPELPRFTGGVVGYFGYETIQYIEPRLKGEAKADVLQTPDIFLMVSKELVVFDSLSGKIFIIVHVDPKQERALASGEMRLDEIAAMLQQPAPKVAAKTPQVPVNFVSEFPEIKFKQAVDGAREYIREGDVMQVVLSQRQSTEFTAPPINLYRSLRSLNPSPYMYYLNMEDFYIVGSSPEILVRLEDDEVTVRPIAGTRPRGKDAQHDLELEAELLQDPKELAEHLMLIDLGRNDVGHVAKTGSVELTDKMIIERYSHVMHIVSNVTGQLDGKLDAIDVLRATFPAGTVSGAPKIRAMEIISEYELTKRGIYSGAVGYISWDGNMDTAIAIRTAVIKDEKLYIQAGAGIVYDSVPENEWIETNNKAGAMLKAAKAAASIV